MFFIDLKLVEGQPLHYYHYHHQPEDRRYSTCFQQFEDLKSGENMSNELSMHSTSSSQSDSDNSESSVDVPSRTGTKKESKNNKLICCWKHCGLDFDSLELLANHVTRQHAASGPGGLFYCGWDGCSRNEKGFNARYKMLVHVRTHTNEKPHRCLQCHKSFSRAENLKIHSRSHSGEKPYVCTVPGCGKAYSNSSDRFKHSRTHQVDKPYCCKVPGCPKRYTDPSSLRKHVKTYKHFVNNDNNNVNSIADNFVMENSIVSENGRMGEFELTKVLCRVESHDQKSHTKVGDGCDCPHFCISNGEMEINGHHRRNNNGFVVQENVINLSWKRFQEDLPIKPVFKKEKIHIIDMDVPLDLSINRYEV